jgi:hypothetical protein
MFWQKIPSRWNIYGKVHVDMSCQIQQGTTFITFTVIKHQLKVFEHPVTQITNFSQGQIYVKIL